MQFIRKAEHLDTDINIVPIIDCLVMLICFLLFTATFTQLVYIEAKMASTTAMAADKSRSEFDQFRLVVELDERGIRLKTSGSLVKGKIDELIPNKTEGYDFKSLHQKIIQLKVANPERFSADLEIKGNKSMAYENITSLIDSIHHLTDEESSLLRISQKKMKNIPLSDMEKEKIAAPMLDQLAVSLASNEVSKNTDTKLLFPDVAILGID